MINNIYIFGTLFMIYKHTTLSNGHELKIMLMSLLSAEHDWSYHILN